MTGGDASQRRAGARPRVIIGGMDRLRDRVILITGSTGIAAAAAERCVAEGASVFVTSRTADHARGLAERLGAAWAQAELTDEADGGRRRDRGSRAIRPDRWPVLGRRRQRPAVR